MGEVGKIQFSANPESAHPYGHGMEKAQQIGPLKGWPQPKTKEELLDKPANPDKYLSHKPINVLDKQVGGNHYKQYKIQPYEFFIVNQIPHHKAAIIRRILRYDHPTGKGLEDLQKITHEVEMIIQLENWEEGSEIGTQTKEKTCKCK